MIQRNPRVIGGIYQTGQVIDSGPVLTDYTAYNRNTGDVVGLHVIQLPDVALLDDSSSLRLLQPLERRKLVQSPHAIHVYDWGIDGSRMYIATDPPRGITLRQLLDAENIDMRRALELAQQMARGLVALQSQGIADIDMRPHLITVDILAESDRAQFDDIGLRLLLKQLGYDQDQHDGLGDLDPRYASPEHLQKGRVGPWSDIYQLGLLIYEVVAGRLPFVGHNPAETGMLQVSAPVPRLAQFTSVAPPALQDLLDCALAKDPAQRFASAQAMLSALERVAALAPASMRPQPSGAQLTPIPGALAAGQVKGHTTEMDDVPAPVDAALEDTAIEGGSTVFKTAVNPGEGGAGESALAYLDYEQEGQQPLRLAIKSNYVIVGRVDPRRNIRPEIDLTGIDPHMTVSRQHARIRYEQTFFYIEDLKSRNKTRHGELALTPLKPEVLKPGDVIHFGSVRVVFHVPDMKEGSALQEH